MQENIFYEQYELVKSSRSVMIEYVERMKPFDFKKEIKHFGRGSICNTITHIARTYQFWVQGFTMRGNVTYFESEIIISPPQLHSMFDIVNTFMVEFIEHISSKPQHTVTGKIPWNEKELTVTHLQLFSHVITHEFHHKGQIMSMGRQLAYIPPDADIIR
jgi:uncharacterized damage-inducible protein DinB